MYQFIHYELYSLLPTHKSKSYISVAREFMRNEHACPHVNNPQKPIIIFGVDAIEAEVIIKNRVDKAKDKIGRKLRRDAKVVLSGVCSLPPEIHVSDIENGTQVTESWIDENLSYLVKKYGDDLLSVVLHLDEGEPVHPHLHFVVAIPDTPELGKANLMYLHEPILARQTTKGGKKAKFDAYRKAYRQLQDEYHREVSEKFGLLRLGPKRQRLTRAEYNARKAQAVSVQESLNDIQRQTQAIEDSQQVIAKQRVNIDKVKKRLSIRNRALLKREEIVENAIKGKYRNRTAVKFYSEKLARLKLKNRRLVSELSEQEKINSEIRNMSYGYQRKILEQDKEIKSLTNKVINKDNIINKIRKSKTKIISKNGSKYNYER